MELAAVDEALANDASDALRQSRRQLAAELDQLTHRTRSLKSLKS